MRGRQRTARGVRSNWGLALALIAVLVGQVLSLGAETDWSALIGQAKPAVVWIVVETSEGTSAGSGTIISPNGYILTAAHVIQGASKITVVVDDLREYRATVTKADYDMDVAILKIPASGLTWLALGNSDEVQYDEEIRVLGYPLPGHAGVGFAAVEGKIQGFRVRSGVRLLQHDAPTEGGHSGGAVIDDQGKIIAVHTSWIGGEHSQYTIGVAINAAKGIIPYGVLPSGPSPVQPPTSPGVSTGPIRVPQDYPDLVTAVRAAPDGAEIVVSRGTYQGDVTIIKPLSIVGEEGVIIAGTLKIRGAQSVFLEDFEVRGGVEISDTDSFALDRVVVTGSLRDGVIVESSSGAISECTIEDSKGAGITASFGAWITVTKTTIRGNSKAGIHLSLNAQARIAECTIERNGAEGIYIAAATADIRENTIRNNTGCAVWASGDATCAPLDLITANTFSTNHTGNVCGPKSPSLFAIEGLSVDPPPPFESGIMPLISASVRNTGDQVGTKLVWLEVDGVSTKETEISLSPGESKTVSFRSHALEHGTHTVRICGPDINTALLSINVLVRSSEFRVARIVAEGPAPLAPGSNALISARIENIGDYSGTKLVQLEIDGSCVAEESLSLEEKVSEWISFTHTFSDPGAYRARIRTPDANGEIIVVVRSPELIRTLTGPGVAYSVTFSPDGQLIASGSSMGSTIKLWDVARGQLVRTLTGHTGTVNLVAFSPDGQLIASGSTDEMIKLWDVATGKLVRTLSGHTDSVNSVAFSPDGRLIASGSRDHTIRLWDVATGQVVHTLLLTFFLNFDSLVFSPDGQRIASSSDAGNVELWDVATGRLVRTLTGSGDLAFSPDGRILAASTKLLDATTGNLVRDLVGHTSWVNSVAFSPDGQLFVSCSSDHTIKLWDAESGSIIHDIGGPGGSPVVFTPDGKTLASHRSSPRTIELWDVATGRLVHTPEIPPTPGDVNFARVKAFSPDGQLLAFGGGKAMHLIDVATGQLVHTLSEKYVMSVAFSPDGQFLASASIRGENKLWDVESGSLLQTMDATFDGFGRWDTSLAFTPSGKYLASGSTDHSIKLWNVAAGKIVRSLTGHTGTVNSVAFSPDGRLIASGSRDSTIKLWRATTEGFDVSTLTGHTGTVNSVAFSPDGRLLASGSSDHTIKLWDVESESLSHTFYGHMGSVNSVAFSPDGQLLFSTSGSNVGVWDTSNLATR